MTKTINAAGHVKRLQEHVRAIEKAEEVEVGAKNVKDEWEAKAKEAFATLRELIVHPWEQLDPELLDSGGREVVDYKAYVRKIAEREAEVARAVDAEGLATTALKKARALTKTLVGHLRVLVNDPGAELPFEGGEEGDDVVP